MCIYNIYIYIYIYIYSINKKKLNYKLRKKKLIIGPFKFKLICSLRFYLID